MFKAAKRLLPIKSGFFGPRFVIVEDGKRYFTTLFVVLLVIEATDVIFAFDSIPAIFGVTTDPFIVMTSNIFAILGLRAMYFVLAGMIDRFHYLTYALALVLAFVAVKLILHNFYHIPNTVSLAVIVVVLTVGVVASIRAPIPSSPGGAEDAAPGGAPDGAAPPPPHRRSQRAGAERCAGLRWAIVTA